MRSDRTGVIFYQMSDVYMCPPGVSLYSIPPQALAIFCLLPHQAGAVGRKNFGDNMPCIRMQQAFKFQRTI